MSCSVTRPEACPGSGIAAANPVIRLLFPRLMLYLP
jgi:hypothetical protein